MTTQDFQSMLADAKKGAGLITAGGVTLQCISASHGVSKTGGDPQIVGSYKIVGGQFNGRTMKAWHTLKSDTPASVMGFFETMAAHGIPEQEIVAMGQPNDQAMAALAAKMVNKVVGADVYHQPDNRDPSKKSAWLQAFRIHTGPMPQTAANGAAPAPAPAGYPAQQPPGYGQPTQTPAPVYQQPQYAPQQPVYGQPQVPQAPALGQVYQPQAPAPQQNGAAPAPSQQYQQAPMPGYPQAPAQHAPAPQAGPTAGDPAQQPQPPVQSVPGEQQYNQDPPF